jgi:1-acyl-sn-glycerol-3-phosphate acyltransferase
MKDISRFILCTLLGWKINGTFPTTIKKYVIIIAPHTHWVDFPMGLLVRSALGLKVNFIGKQSLFNWPYGYFFRALGGTPVDRAKSNNKVDAIVEIFNQKEQFILSLSPEGTRKKVKKWKTGFYYIAKGAKVPIICGVLDYENKVFTSLAPFYVTDNLDADMVKLRKGYEGVKGKVAEYS